jgi:hypothetical protein
MDQNQNRFLAHEPPEVNGDTGKGEPFGTPVDEQRPLEPTIRAQCGPHCAPNRWGENQVGDIPGLKQGFKPCAVCIFNDGNCLSLSQRVQPGTCPIKQRADSGLFHRRVGIGKIISGNMVRCFPNGRFLFLPGWA